MPIADIPRVDSEPIRPKRARARRALAALSATVALAAVFTTGAVTQESVSNKSQAAVTTTTAKLTVPKGWKLTFNQTFSGTKLNTKVWATCYWWVKPGKGCTNFADVNAEKEWYLPAQDKVSDRELHLVAKREVTEGTNAKGKPEKYSCRSGMVTSNPGFNFEYGFVQFTVNIPYGKGLWPALWLAASNHKYPPEIDVLEHWAAQTNAGVYLHPVTGARQGGRVTLHTNLSKGWHTITLYWTKTRLTWYYDGRQMFTTKTHIPQQKMYLIMNLADTSTAAGNCNGTMLVKSVKVWQPK